MAVFLWYLVKSDLSSLHLYSGVHWTVDMLLYARYHKNTVMFNWSPCIIIILLFSTSTSSPTRGPGQDLKIKLKLDKSDLILDKSDLSSITPLPNVDTSKSKQNQRQEDVEETPSSNLSSVIDPASPKIFLPVLPRRKVEKQPNLSDTSNNPPNLRRRSFEKQTSPDDSSSKSSKLAESSVENQPSSSETSSNSAKLSKRGVDKQSSIYDTPAKLPRRNINKQPSPSVPTSKPPIVHKKNPERKQNLYTSTKTEESPKLEVLTNTELSTKLEDSKKTEASTKLDAPIAVPNSEATLPAPDSTDVSKVMPFTFFIALTPVTTIKNISIFAYAILCNAM